MYKNEGEDNTGGLQVIGYYGFVSDIKRSTFPKIADAPADLEANIAITADIEMNTGKTMFPMYGQSEKSGLDGETIGEAGSQSTKRVAGWFYPGTSKKALGFARGLLNRDMVFIWIENNGQKRLQGTPAIPASVTVKDSIGKTSGDAKGITLEVTDYGCGPCPVYEGTIPVDSSVDLGV